MRNLGILRFVLAVSALAAQALWAEKSFVVSDPCIWRDDAAKVYRLYQLSRRHN